MIVAVADTHTAIWYLFDNPRHSANAVQDLIRGLFDPEYPLYELPVDASIAERMASISRNEVSDMPGRIVAATGLRYGVPVISRDRKIRASQIQTIW